MNGTEGQGRKSKTTFAVDHHMGTILANTTRFLRQINLIHFVVSSATQGLSAVSIRYRRTVQAQVHAENRAAHRGSC